jgi:hypothetical protein
MSHVRYIYSNSWKHQGILPRDYPYHNFWEAVRRGWVDVDFCVPTSAKTMGLRMVAEDGRRGADADDRRGTPGP